MIKFKNITGDAFLAVGSIKRKSALNGEKSLTGTLFKGDDVLNEIDKGWSLEFDNEPYVVTYFERNDNDNTVGFDAIHKFFWDMNKSVLYSSASGSHTAKWYLDQIFNGTGYTYALNFDPSAFEKENWGMKNRLSLFNDVITSVGGEFEINGNMVAIFKNIGSDLSTIVRHGFNLSDMSLENDSAGFVTYGEGFGIYDDPENQKGNRLHVTYTSPLAKVYGKLEAEPIDDQRYTKKDSLVQAIKNKVDSSFTTSITLSLYDLTAAGYPYKMANVGDWLLAIDENLDFKQKIRIISVDDEFTADGTRISYTVTAGDVTLTKKYQDANATLAQKVDSVFQNSQDAKEAAIQAIISANGKNKNYYVDSFEELEKIKANEGDLGFVRDGDSWQMYVYERMPDGSLKWVKHIDPEMGKQIAAGVEHAISEANSYADSLNATQASEAAEFQSAANDALTSASAERNSLASQANAMSESAHSYATSMANSAAAYGKEQANNALSNANSELAKAKQELGSEVSKAQSDILATNHELSGKVSQVDFNKVTGDLTDKYSQVKLTAENVGITLNSYKESADKRITANENSIGLFQDQLKFKVSQTDFDKRTQTVDSKFADQTIMNNKINLAVGELQEKANAQGQINQLMNTEFNPDLEGWVASADVGSSLPYRSYWQPNIQATVIGFDTKNSSANTFARFRQDVQFSNTPTAGHTISLSWYAYTNQTDFYNTLWLRFYDNAGNKISDTYHAWASPNSANNWNVQNKWENISVPDTAVKVNVSFEAREGTGAYLGHPMLVFGPTVGDYVTGQYNNNNRVAALELGIDHITGLVNDPAKGLSATWNLASNGQTLAINAQTDATTAITTAKGMQTTVSSVQGDVKSLQTQQTITAGQVTAEIQDRKNGDSASETLLKNLIEQRVQSVTTGYQGAIQTMANGVLASVSKPNQLLNTEFSPDLEGWTVTNNGGTSKPYRSYIDAAIGSTSVGFNTVGDPASTYGSTVAQDVPVSAGSNVPISMRWDVRTVRNDYYTNLWLTFKDATGVQLGRTNKQWSYTTADNRWHEIKWENVALPEGTRIINVSFEVRENTTQYLARPMLVFGSTIGTYMAGSYSGMNTSTVLELFKDNWALGIANNAGRIISGINGDTSGTVIQGKKLVINSDTTINGKAFIDGSVIKNASIGNAQIGNAAIGSAQIINVDVSKISGNIANFITANVDTLNARVLYGDTGHLGTIDTGRVINKQDNHLQLAAKGFYDSTNDRAQLELLGNSDNSISDDMKGSLNYYGNPTDKGHGLGIRMKYNQILAIDEDGGSKNLYLSPYAGGQVRIVSRDLNSYYDIAAANFRVSSQRKFKSDIKPLDDGALDIVNKTNIKSYTKNGVSEIGVIADEAPSELLSDDGKFINIYDYTSVLYKAVQELSVQVKELQNERPNN